MKINKIEPAFEGNKNCIVFSTDANFVPLTAVAIQSIIETASASNVYDILILHKNLSLFTQYSVCKMAENIDHVSIRFFNMNDMISDDTLYTANRKTLSQETYYRLYIPWILADAYEKALYIDGDMILLEDIAQLIQVDMGQNLIAAVKDYWGICNCYIPGDPRMEYQTGIGIKDVNGYVIGATILFNLPAFRSGYSVSDVKECINQRQWKQHDQDIINVLCQGRIHYLSPRWGWMSDYGNNHYLPEKLLEELAEVGPTPAIVHFGGGRKPYVQVCADFDAQFWNYADHTPYFATLYKQVKSFEYKGYIVHNLLGKEFEEGWSATEVIRSYKGVNLGGLQSGHTRYRAIRVNGDVLHLEGMVGFFGVSLDTDVKIFMKVNDTLIPVTEQTREDGFNKKKKVTLYRGEAFKADIPLADPNVSYRVSIVAMLDGMPIEKTNLGFEKYCPLGRKYKRGYFHAGNWLVETNKHVLNVHYASAAELKAKEERFCKEIWADKKYHAVIARKLVRFMRKLIKKPIWIVSDRLSRADDNGEAFFQYLRENKKDEVSAYFVIGKNCDDYKRMQQYGHIIPAYSYRHKLLHLLAEYSISAQTDDVFRNPFGSLLDCYRDMLADTKFVFLQHGIIVNDLRDWLHDRRQQMAGFVTSTKREYEAIAHGGYGYPEEKVWLTGLARFDRLYNVANKTVTILPTWRMYLTTRQNHQTGVWELKNGFSESTYATFYRNLMHDERLRSKAKELGYTVRFKIHPSFMSHESKFGFDENVCLVDPDLSYRELYATSSLIVTDYTSAISDFVYLHKPIVYCHFDRDEFYSGGHIAKDGSFDYEQEGFGEVEYDLDGTVNRIIEYMENGCQLKDEYRERIDNYFVYNDKNNCQRVYDKMMEASSK